MQEVKQEKEVEEVGEEKQGYLTEAGMLGDSPGEIVTWMEQWQPKAKHLTKGSNKKKHRKKWDFVPLLVTPPPPPPVRDTLNEFYKKKFVH